MDRILGLLHKQQNTVETPLAEWNFQGCARSESECADGSDVCQQKIFKACVIRDIKKYRSRINFRLWRVLISSCGLSCWHCGIDFFLRLPLTSWSVSRIPQS